MPHEVNRVKIIRNKCRNLYFIVHFFKALVDITEQHYIFFSKERSTVIENVIIKTPNILFDLITISSN